MVYWPDISNTVMDSGTAIACEISRSDGGTFDAIGRLLKRWSEWRRNLKWSIDNNCRRPLDVVASKSGCVTRTKTKIWLHHFGMMELKKYPNESRPLLESSGIGGSIPEDSVQPTQCIGSMPCSLLSRNPLLPEPHPVLLRSARLDTGQSWPS